MQTEISKLKDPIERVFCFAHERHQIYLKKENGEKPPWTKDPILRKYRFCCTYREFDKVTKWIRENWRVPHNDDPDLWFAMCLARTFNKPETLEVIGWPVPFDPIENARMAKRLHHYRDKTGNPVFNGAYIISPGGVSDPVVGHKYFLTQKKLAYVWQNMIDLWKARTRMRPVKMDTLNSYHMLLGQMQGFGSFMSAQVVADLKYHPPLKDAPDWETFAASGPGSRRGLNYVLERDRNAKWTEEEFRLELGRLRDKLLPMFARSQMPKPHAQDIQNVLCEFNKYWGMVSEGKKPKQKYEPGV